MKIAIISDIHDNLTRWEEVARSLESRKINVAICCGDVTSIDTLEIVSESLKTVYLALGNADHDIKIKTGLVPENVEWAEEVFSLNLEGLKIGIVHNDRVAEQLANTGKYDVVFYGHTHTPWEKIVGKTLLLNPGEVCGRYGQPSFAIFNTKSNVANLQLII